MGVKRGVSNSKPRKGRRYQQSCFWYFMGKLICFAYSKGFELTPSDGTIEVILCDKCGNRVSTHSRSSYHHIRLAQDLNLFKQDSSGGWKYQRTTKQHKILGDYWKSLDPLCTWGGDFRKKDGNHYSYGEGKRM